MPEVIKGVIKPKKGKQLNNTVVYFDSIETAELYLQFVAIRKITFPLLENMVLRNYFVPDDKLHLIPVKTLEMVKNAIQEAKLEGAYPI